MKIITQIASSLLGIAFLTFGLNYFIGFLETPGPPPAGSPAALFFGAIGPTGFFTFVKILEIIGGIIVIIPQTRNLGLLLLGPIVVNILAFKIFITSGAGLFAPPVLAITFLSAFVLWNQRTDFIKLILKK